MNLLELHDVLISCLRWLCGLGIGASAAVIVALLVRAAQPIRTPLVAVTNFFRALPILALVPVFIWLLHINELTKILLIAWACFFPVFVATNRAAGRNIEDLELRMAASGLGWFDRFKHYEAPRLLFGFIAGVEIAVGIGWLTVVAAEMIGTDNQGWFRGGLGHAVYSAFDAPNYPLGLFCLAIFGALGLASAALWSFIARGLVQLLGYDRAALASV